MIASAGCSFSGVGFVFRKPLSPKHRSTFLPLQHAATLIISVDWGLGYQGHYAEDHTSTSETRVRESGAELCQ